MLLYLASPNRNPPFVVPLPRHANTNQAFPLHCRYGLSAFIGAPSVAKLSCDLVCCSLVMHVACFKGLFVAQLTAGATAWLGTAVIAVDPEDQLGRIGGGKDDPVACRL